MSAESDLLRVVLALQMGFVTRGQVIECAARWAEARDKALTQTNSRENDMRPCPVDSFPADESPFGVRGLAGNSRDLCLNDAAKEKWVGWRQLRGGYWSTGGTNCRPTRRTVTQPHDVSRFIGGRLACFPRCKTPRGN